MRTTVRYGSKRTDRTATNGGWIEDFNNDGMSWHPTETGPTARDGLTTMVRYGSKATDRSMATDGSTVTGASTTTDGMTKTDGSTKKDKLAAMDGLTVMDGSKAADGLTVINEPTATIRDWLDDPNNDSISWHMTPNEPTSMDGMTANERKDQATECCKNVERCFQFCCSYS